MTFFSKFHNILSSIVSFLIPFFTDCYFFIIPESDSLKGQNKPAYKRKKPIQNQPVPKRIKTVPVPKRIKTVKLTGTPPVVGLVGDNEDAEFVGGPVIKKSKKKKTG